MKHLYDMNLWGYRSSDERRSLSPADKCEKQQAGDRTTCTCISYIIDSDLNGGNGMKKLMKILAAIMTAIPLTFTGTGASVPVQVQAEEAEGAGAGAYTTEGELIYYYREGDVQFDEQRVLQKIRKSSQLHYNYWVNILNKWRWIDNEMEIPDTAPESIPNESTHAFVLLGGGVDANGDIPEGGAGAARCDLAYECAMKYPQSKIVITGGKTTYILRKRNRSEAEAMRDYLVNVKHLDSSRIILETQAGSTIYNAINTMKLLYEDTDIRSATIITSDYHVRRSTLLFYTQSLFDSTEMGKPMIDIVGGCGSYDDPSKEGVASEAYSLASLTGNRIPSYLPVSELKELKVTGDNIVAVGAQPSIQTYAVYSVEDYTVNVTGKAAVSAIDTSAAGTQTVTVTYSDDLGSASGTMDVRVVDPSVMPYVMYRVYNPNSGEHFFTNNAAEKNNLVNAGWRNEGLAWFRAADQTQPVYRLYNKKGGEHHYTLSAGERDSLVAAGWKYEGIGWYSDPSSSVAVYRVYNPNAFANNHHYTTNRAEAARLISLGWRDEGIGWYGQDIS